MNLPDYFKESNKRADVWNMNYSIFLLLCSPIVFYLVFTNDNSLLGEIISIIIGAIAFAWFIALFFVMEKD